MKNITNSDISQYTGRSNSTVAGWSSKQPKMLEIIRLGALCKKNNLDEEKIIKLIELQEMIRGKE
ncbi:hypothetical protein [Sulfuricurvum sp.]|uniref:hypothetical protein n=1 Tax=Sulfuricurvum sp. TaxID=2025608 RepID=UPI00263759E0|nr:hypothetical protein [Sulfuricurvum sp.]